MDTTEIIKEALQVLKDGGIILYPTDTVWGIGCDATNEKAVAKIYEIKRRSDSKSLVLLASDLDMVAKHVKTIPDIAIDLVEVNDKPMTIIYPGAQYLAPNAVAADGTVGIRIPLNDFCKELVRRFRKPIVSTSANISGEPTPHFFKEISDEIKSAVDYTVNPKLELGSTGEASQIIKLSVDGVVEIIRP
ncbi:MAG: threonylcarbamoyl-AMP synthase [Bacteroidales bacterium]|nr:threonylcarbamoyl-AMP synthase [Bacteroidales bacterium]